MELIVVVDGEPDELGSIRRAAAGAAVTITSTDPAGAMQAVAAGAGRDAGCVVAGIGSAAGAAFDAAAEHGAILGFVSLSGQLEPRHMAMIEDWPELPVLTVAGPEDRTALDAAVTAYLASTHAASEVIVERTPPVDDLTAWLVGRATGRVEVTEVAFTSSDGWQIHATRRVPSSGRPVPGVVLLHTGRSDRSAFARLERLLGEAGLAVLNIDWRGRGESTNLGSYFDLSDDTKAAAWRDALAAFDALAADPRIDGDRLGAVGCVHGAEYAVRAAWRDRRVKAVVVLTGYRPHEPEETDLLVSGDIDVMYVTGTGHTITSQAMRDLHQRAPRRSSHMIEYPGSALGYQLFEQDPALEPTIVTWLGEVLHTTGRQ